MLILLALCSIVYAQPPAPPPNSIVVSALADRILECRMPATGTLHLEPFEKRPGGLVPYFAHFAAYGLLRAYEVTQKPEYLQAADQWIDWYRDHQQDDGTVTDYKLNDDDTYTSTGDMDSTDSYAAMYLWLVAERWRVCQEPAGWLRDHELSCLRGVSAILLTMQDDNLTIAKPTYPIEYAMDNAEVIVGFRSAVTIFETLGNPGMANHVKKLAENTETALRQSLYSPEHGYFAWYRALDGTTAYELNKWYPDVMAQVLVLMRIGKPTKTDQDVFRKIAQTHLVNEFNRDKPWDHIWYGLAAKRVYNDEWTHKILAPLNNLTPEVIANFDAIQCNSVLEAMTGGTKPRW